MSGELLIEVSGLQPQGLADAAPLDLSVSDGLVVLVGPARERISAYLRALAGIEPSAGSLRLLGHDLATAAPDWQWLRRRVGYVTPDAPLLSIMSGLRNVMLPGLYHRLGSEAEVQATAQALLAEMTYVADHDCLPAFMPELQRHHLLIARALILQPRVLVLERPLGGLEREAAAMLRSYIISAVRQRVPLVLLADNDPLLAQQAARLVFIGRSTVRVFDDWSALLASGEDEVRQFIAVEQAICQAYGHG